jgi:glycosyltransferase involved in cell wall biosynthesis
METKINTFIVPTTNYDGIKKTLESIRKYTPPNFYIYLIDQREKYLEGVDDLVDLHIYTNGKNIGYAKAFNTGIRLSDTKYVTIWNDDCECINLRWWEGIEETFRRYSTTALGVNPSSPRNPRASGDMPVNNMGIDHKEEFTEEDYDSMIEQGKGHIIDGICMFATVFDRAKLDKVIGVLPNKAWMDEWFYPGGGEDYSLNRQGYLTKNEENGFRGYRCLGTNLSFVWHFWYSSRRMSDGVAGVKHCGNQWSDKWGTVDGGNIDLYGKTGGDNVPMNIIRPLDNCYTLDEYKNLPKL